MSLRTQHVSIYLTGEELDMARERASARGVPLAVYLRAIALQEPLRGTPIPAINLATARGVNQIGNNLNQLVKLAHSGRISAELAASVAEVLTLCRAIEHDLLTPREKDAFS